MKNLCIILTFLIVSLLSTPIFALEAPILTMSTSGTTISLSWTSSVDATGSILYYAPYPDASYIGQIDMADETSLSFDASGLAFYVAVKTYNTFENSIFSNIEYFDMPNTSFGYVFSHTDMDFKGDGRSDIGVYDGSENWHVALSNGNGFDTATAWDVTWNLNLTQGTQQFVFAGDFNGDLRSDIGVYDGSENWHVALSNGNGFDTATAWNVTWNLNLTQGTQQFVFAGDFNGDLRSDIGVYDGSGNWYVALSNGSGFDTATAWDVTWNLNLTQGTQQFVFAGDFNGDLRSDIGVYDGSGNWYVALSNGSGFDTTTAWDVTWNLNWTPQFIFTGDFNGDNRSDIGVHDGSANWYVALSNGSGFDTTTAWDVTWNLNWQQYIILPN